MIVTFPFYEYFEQKRILLSPPFKNNLLRKMQLRLKTMAAMHPNNDRRRIKTGRFLQNRHSTALMKMMGERQACIEV